MASTLDILVQNSKLFVPKPPRVSYPIGFPVLDQILGCRYYYTYEDGTQRVETRLGIGAGTITMILGASQSGKTTAGIQAGLNIIEPFDEYTFMIHDDGENATDMERVQSVSGRSTSFLDERYRIVPSFEVNTYDHILKQVDDIIKMKKANKKNFMYNSGVKDIHGNDIICYKPTVLLLDSLMRFTSDGVEKNEVGDLYEGGREAVYRGKFLRNLLEKIEPYNIIIFIIHHWSVDMRQQQMGAIKSKQLPNLPSGVYVTGGDKLLLYCTNIILFRPDNDKKGVKTELINGYNGRPVDALLSKSRGGDTGSVAHLEFVQEIGFDPRLILMNYAKEKNLIKGVNPKSRFESMPDITFDTRKLIKEIGEKPEIIRALYTECRPHLDSLIPWMDVGSNDPIRGGQAKIVSRQMLRDMYAKMTDQP